jgi:urea transport system ATP-binding protein
MALPAAASRKLVRKQQERERKSASCESSKRRPRMTPDLMEEGTRRMQAVRSSGAGTESGGRKAGSRIATPGEVDTTHGRILYLEDVHVSFDGFKAINGLNLDIAPASCAASSAPTARARPR